MDDAPFLAVAMAVEETDAGPILSFRTNVDDDVQAGPEHPIRFEQDPTGGMKPYIKVRGDLWAKVSRPVFYDLAALGQEREVDGVPMFGISSKGAFFPMIEAALLADWV